MKTEVYSWRVSADLKMSLEQEALRRKMSVSALLDLAARDLLGKRDSEEDEQEQSRLRKAAEDCFGEFAGGDAFASEKVRETVRRRVREKYGR